MKTFVLLLFFFWACPGFASDSHKGHLPPSLDMQVSRKLFFRINDEEISPLHEPDEIRLGRLQRDVRNALKSRMQALGWGYSEVNGEKSANDSSMPSLIRFQSTKSHGNGRPLWHIDFDFRPDAAFPVGITVEDNALSVDEEAFFWHKFFSEKLPPTAHIKLKPQLHLELSLAQWDERLGGNPLLLVNFLTALYNNPQFFYMIHGLMPEVLHYQDDPFFEHGFIQWSEEMRKLHQSRSLTLERVRQSYEKNVGNAYDPLIAFFDLEEERLILRSQSAFLADPLFEPHFARSIYSSLSAEKQENLDFQDITEMDRRFDLDQILKQMALHMDLGSIRGSTAIKAWHNKILEDFFSPYRDPIAGFEEIFYRHHIPQLRKIPWFNNERLREAVKFYLKAAERIEEWELLLDARFMDVHVLRAYPELQNALQEKVNAVYRLENSGKRAVFLEVLERFILETGLREIPYWEGWIRQRWHQNPKKFLHRLSQLPGDHFHQNQRVQAFIHELIMKEARDPALQESFIDLFKAMTPAMLERQKMALKTIFIYFLSLGYDLEHLLQADFKPHYDPFNDAEVQDFARQLILQVSEPGKQRTLMDLLTKKMIDQSQTHDQKTALVEKGCLILVPNK